MKHYLFLFISLFAFIGNAEAEDVQLLLRNGDQKFMGNNSFQEYISSTTGGFHLYWLYDNEFTNNTTAYNDLNTLVSGTDKFPITDYWCQPFTFKAGTIYNGYNVVYTKKTGVKVELSINYFSDLTKSWTANTTANKTLYDGTAGGTAITSGGLTLKDLQAIDANITANSYIRGISIVCTSTDGTSTVGEVDFTNAYLTRTTSDYTETKLRQNDDNSALLTGTISNWNWYNGIAEFDLSTNYTNVVGGTAINATQYKYIKVVLGSALNSGSSLVISNLNDKNTDYHYYKADATTYYLPIFGGTNKLRMYMATGQFSDAVTAYLTADALPSDAPAQTAFKRNVTVNNYGTICLPYDATAPNEVTLYTVASKNSETPTYINLDETGSKTMTAGTAYIFTSTIDQPIFNYTGTTYTEPTTGGALVGCYDATTVPVGDYILNTNKWYKVDNTFTSGEYRAYLDMSKVSVVAAAKGTDAMDIDNTETTGITSVKSATKNADIYSIQGIKMNQNNLNKGLYIKNGKTFVVK